MRTGIRYRRVLNAQREFEERRIFFVNGQEVSEEAFLAVVPDQKLDFSQGAPGGSTDWHKPILSDGLAVVPKRIKDAEAFTERIGVPTDFSTHRGRPIIKSREHRKKLLKAFKLHDNNGGYGD